MTAQFGNQVSIFHDSSGLYLTVFELHRVTAVPAIKKKWNQAITDLCPCGVRQTMSHIVDSCPVTKLNGSLFNYALPMMKLLLGDH